MRRPDSPQWVAAKTEGDRAALAVAEWFQGRGFAVLQTIGKASFDLQLQANVEVKHDLRAIETGNIAIEIAYNGKPSGIYQTDAVWWAYVVGSDAIITKIDVLRILVEREGNVPRKAGDGGRATIVLVKLADLRSMPNVFVVPLAGVA